MINWFPGHMHSARQQIAEAMPKIDLVIEVLDARLPMASSNPLLAEMRGVKPCIKVLNKNDLADPEVTGEWVRFFESRGKGMKALAINATRKAELTRLVRLSRSLVPHRGGPGKPLRIMIVGIPNVGKSTLINTLCGRKIAKVGDKPAITRSAQQVDLRNGILLFDTPGVLAPNLEDQRGAMCLAATGAIGDNAMDHERIAAFTGDFLLERYPQQLIERYRLKELPQNGELLIEQVGRRRGCLMAGGVVDRQRAAEIVLHDLQAGRLGRISMESLADTGTE
ncbi:ribosomal biogenesis GTPase [Syntrophotalea carbinolica DSM 2380]|uniref:Ribosome biogenesis GTPase A n=1 Tax=Syntrophotalea carbinolica (strain DSM 2380 / NBRC 103641 / GraBd1) TaxID=338963 RepID=Q3A6H5_SYNC1|nr:ribosome biogenesis GTPase YlqF [Syntrophotalea carbinolica]ABA88032.1 ribosomal biogenesis GTPase [Syntrophotalea carbinolica DSM 2380]